MRNTDGEASENGENAVLELDQPGDAKALRMMIDWTKAKSPQFATKRDFMKLAGGSATAGALLGSSFLAGQASAQPDGDEGSIGEQGDRVEAWISEADANSLDVEEGPAEVKRIKATASDAQSRIQNLGEYEVAHVYGGRYDPGSETTIPVRATVKFLDSAWWEPTSNYSGFLVDLGATLIGQSITGSPFGGTGAPDVLRTPNHVVAIDATRASGNQRYDTTTNLSAPAVDWTSLGESVDSSSGDAGHGLNLVADSNAGPISIETEIKWTSQGYADAIRADPGGAYININDFFIQIDDFETGIRHHGTGPFNSHVTGMIHADNTGANGDRGIYNETTDTSVAFEGHMWDVTKYNTQPIDGPYIKVIDTVGPVIDDIQGQGAAGSGTVARSFDRRDKEMLIWDGANDVIHSQFFGSDYELRLAGQDRTTIYEVVSPADDSVMTIDVMNHGLVYVGADGNSIQGLFITDYNSVANSLLGSDITAQSSTDLTGTTGPDGSLNISRFEHDLHIENRLGSQTDVHVQSWRAR